MIASSKVKQYRSPQVKRVGNVKDMNRDKMGTDGQGNWVSTG